MGLQSHGAVVVLGASEFNWNLFGILREDSMRVGWMRFLYVSWVLPGMEGGGWSAEFGGTAGHATLGITTVPSLREPEYQYSTPF